MKDFPLNKLYYILGFNLLFQKIKQLITQSMNNKS